MMCFPSVGTRLISQKKCSSLHLLLQWMGTMPSFWNGNTVYRNCTVLCDTIRHNVSQSHRITLNQKRSHWLLVVIVDLGSSYYLHDRVKINTSQLRSRYDDSVCYEHEQHVTCSAIARSKSKTAGGEFFSKYRISIKIFFFFFPGCQTCLHVFIGFLLSINPSWLKPLPVERCLVSLRGPELCTKARKAHYIRLVCLQNEILSFHLKFGGQKNPSKFYCPRPTCARFRPNDENQDLPETPGHWGRA